MDVVRQSDHESRETLCVKVIMKAEKHKILVT